jgi:5'-methylthioadenosine phosphorylase
MKLGVIGGSGLYSVEEGGKGEFLKVQTPYGTPSGEIFKLSRGDRELFFLPRHGKGHTLLPSEVNYRANLFALKKLGVRTVLSVSAVGSLQAEIAPGEFVLPDQYIDRTLGLREKTFFGNGIVGHAHFADPACAALREHVAAELAKLKVKHHVGGTYVCMEGPQFSTRAESHWYRSWSQKGRPIAVIGMTALPEAQLARELGMCYQTLAMATDYDCWNEEKGDVSVEAILKTIAQNVSVSRKLISQLVTSPFPACRSGCTNLMRSAVVTSKELWPASRRDEMEIILS